MIGLWRRMFPLREPPEKYRETADDPRAAQVVQEWRDEMQRQQEKMRHVQLDEENP